MPTEPGPALIPLPDPQNDDQDATMMTRAIQRAALDDFPQLVAARWSALACRLRRDIAR
jgi:hypothetical protein